MLWWGEEDAALAVGRHDGGRVGPLIIGKPQRVPAPQWKGRVGELAVTALTPVVSRCDGGESEYGHPRASAIDQGLRQKVARAYLGVDIRGQEMAVEVVEDSSCAVRVGAVHHSSGWTGEVVLRCNAVAGWLLLIAASGVGLGGRTAYGMGAIHAERR